MPDLIPFEVVDYLAEAQTRVTEQFKSSKDLEGIKPVFNRYLKLLLESQIQIQNTLKDLIQLRDVDTAVGAQLDVIGRIVGQERELIEASVYEFFGFQGAAGAQSFGNKGTGVGGVFRSGQTASGSNITLDDINYRKYIKAKIFKNITTSTPEQFISVVNSIFDTNRCYVDERGDAEFEVYFDKPLTELEKGLLQHISYKQKYPTRLLPKTAGVKMTLKYTGIPDFGVGGYGFAYGATYGL